MTVEAPTADYLAELLGIPPYPDSIAVVGRARRRWEALNLLHGPAVMSPLMRDFAGKYAIQAVDAWNIIKSSHVSLYADVLRACTRNAYWGRFQMNHPRGRIIFIEHAMRLSRATAHPRDDQVNFVNSLTLLWQFIVWEIDNWDPAVIPPDVRMPLIKMTKEFLKECPGAMVKGVEGSSIGKDCLLLLQGKDGGSISRAKMQKQKWESDILQCYCGSREGLDGNILLRCSRCKVVSYCSPEHQKADWKNHKPRCIKPSWE